MGIAAVGDSLMVAFAGTDEIANVSADSGSALEFTHLDEKPLSAPHGIADLGEGVWCVASPVDATIGIFGNKMKLRHFVRLAPEEDQLAVENLPLLKQVRGERTFYQTTKAGLSCQSCHLHTDTDHCQHEIGGDELVGVLTVHGVAGTSPYLREGPYPQLRGLHEVVLEVYRGYNEEVDWDRAEALEQYMSSLPPKANWRTLEKLDRDAMRRGMDVFAKAECIQCHVPPAMTNLGQHPTSVLFPDYGALIEKEFGSRTFLDVPGLRSVALSPPYLHNGRAATLTSIFQDHNSANAHGDTANLSREELGALIYFLEQL